MRRLTPIRLVAALAVASLLLARPAHADPATLQSLYVSASVSTGTTNSTSYPCDSAEVVAIFVSATAGSGNVTVTLQTSPDGSAWYDLGSTGALSSGQSAVLSKTEYDGLGRFYRAKAVVASAATTFSVAAVSR